MPSTSRLLPPSHAPSAGGSQPAQRRARWALAGRAERQPSAPALNRRHPRRQGQGEAGEAAIAFRRSRFSRLFSRANSNQPKARNPESVHAPRLRRQLRREADPRGRDRASAPPAPPPTAAAQGTRLLLQLLHGGRASPCGRRTNLFSQPPSRRAQQTTVKRSPSGCSASSCSASSRGPRSLAQTLLPASPPLASLTALLPRTALRPLLHRSTRCPHHRLECTASESSHLARSGDRSSTWKVTWKVGGTLQVALLLAHDQESWDLESCWKVDFPFYPC